MKRRALGRGLSALIPEQKKTPPSEPTQPDDNDTTAKSGNGAAAATTNGRNGSESTHFLCPVERIRPNKTQPRQHFDESQLADLAQSLREIGVIQPLIVKPDGEDFVLIAGERRWRAAQRAGLQRVPVIIRNVDELQLLEMALVENIQRADLNPIEEAEAYQRLIDDHGYSQTQLAQRVARERSTIANALRLLNLPEQIREAVIYGRISGGHARALLALESVGQMIELVDAIDKGRLSVRQTEALVKQRKDGASARKLKAAIELSSNARDLQERLMQSLKTKVALKPGANNRGRIEVHYGSLDELDRLIEILIQ